MEDYTAEMIKDMAFSFCPQCGAAIVPNHRGRPRKFCSPECRSKWNNTHPRPQNWKTVRSKVCPMCGREFSYSPQVLKANMKIVGATEYALVLYRGKLPKFNNVGADGKTHMIFNWFDWKRDGKDYPKIHPSQKPVSVLKRLIEIFTDPGDVVIDPCAGSGATLRAARELGRNSYGFEVSRDFYLKAKEQMLGEEAV